ncbi:methionyl-tRNA formyltransferase [Acinetobacter nectaris]|uniref:methionyl-tRNA formyltransferase n=1 Tax=Acinetobacter nectaris TaxID=1219382 RepID=UPI001F025C0F|nr:methionyl-tRNA formyltransferase [Acinetobacter nectaris]MCF9000312.1 methionyl-tRNA formyltransferase [Acinetobacter nectaris]MCF9028568.1 methionyl-tRNA formyltransferase [Acinetobacter nectaris]
MRIIFAGTPEFAAVALKALLNSPHEIIAVYTQPDRKAGRGQKLTPSAVKKVALENNIPVYQPLTLKASSDEGLDAQQELKKLNADIMVVAAYGLILPQAVLDIPKYGCLNIHASLLPRWRGAAPIQRAVATQDKETGVTIMQMAAGLDTGDMIFKTSCPIKANDNSAILHDKLAVQGAEAITRVLASESTLKTYLENREVQNEAHVTYAHKLSKAEAKIDWNLPAIQIAANIHAFNPWPVAFIQLETENLRVWQADIISNEKNTEKLRVGTVLNIDQTGITVLCGNNTAILLTSLQWPGGKPLDSQQILQTNKLNVGQILI